MSVVVALGVIFLLGPALARCASSVRLPAITGYVGAGLVVGSATLGVINQAMRPGLETAERLVGCLVVFAIGASLKVSRLRAHARQIRWLTPALLSLTTVALACAQLLLMNRLSFLASLSLSQRLLATLSVGILLASVSPTVVVAVRDELRADGPLTRTVLGAVVLADFVAVSVLITLAFLWTGWLHASERDVGTVLSLVRAVFGALAIGCAIGVIIAYLHETPAWLAVMAVTLASWAYAQSGLFGPVAALMIASSAGVTLANSGTGELRVSQDLERALPTGCGALFGIAGALIDTQRLQALVVPAALLVAVRCIGVWIAAAAAGHAGSFEGNLKKWAFAGLLPQAGFSLAMVQFLPALFPGFGQSARDVVVAAICLNEIIMPPIWRYALQTSGEDGGAMARAADAATWA